MTTSHAILRDLKSGQSTASALSERLRISTEQIETILARHEVDGLVLHSHIGSIHPNPLKVYSLTEKGRQQFS